MTTKALILIAGFAIVLFIAAIAGFYLLYAGDYDALVAGALLQFVAGALLVSLGVISFGVWFVVWLMGRLRS